jgi:large subunit ribosomal protein L24
MNKIKIKSKDLVMAIAGKDSGKTGVVERVFRDQLKATVSGINICKKHLKPNKKSPQGGISEFPAKMNISNLILVCPNCQKPTKVGYKIDNKNKIRICRKCKESVEGAK